MIFIVGGAYQGKTAYAEEVFAGYRVMNHYHEEIRRQMEQGKNPMEEVKKLDLSEEKLVIICNEVGSGLVPIDAFERSYREETGRVGSYLASQASQVIRVICGIGKRIKP